MPANIKPTDRKAAAVIVGLIDGPTRTEKEMLALVSQELVSFRTLFGASGDPVVGSDSVDWAAYLSLRCVLRKMEKDVADIKQSYSLGLDIADKLEELSKHLGSSHRLVRDIKD